MEQADGIGDEIATVKRLTGNRGKRGKSLPGVPADSAATLTPAVDPAELVRTAMADINDRLDEWRPMEGQANKVLYRVLGRIYQAAETFAGNPEAQSALEAEVNRIPEVRKSNRWHAKGKSSTELLLTLVLGLKSETKATKSQWLKALRAAKASKVPPEEVDFASWMETEGGLIAAGRAVKGKDSAGRSLTSKFDLVDFLQAIPEKTADAETIDLQSWSPDGLADVNLLLVHREADGAGGHRVRVIGNSGDRNLITQIAAALDGGQTALQKFEDAQLVLLNRLALRAAGPKRFSGTVSFYHGEAFAKAVKRLAAHPVLREKYFSEEPGLDVTFDTIPPKNPERGKPRSVASLAIKNADYHPFDPGRYISGAKPNVMIPYQIHPENGEETNRSIDEYLERFKKVKVDRSGSRPMITFRDDGSWGDPKLAPAEV